MASCEDVVVVVVPELRIEDEVSSTTGSLSRLGKPMRELAGMRCSVGACEDVGLVGPSKPRLLRRPWAMPSAWECSQGESLDPVCWLGPDG